MQAKNSLVHIRAQMKKKKKKKRTGFFTRERRRWPLTDAMPAERMRVSPAKPHRQPSENALRSKTGDGDRRPFPVKNLTRPKSVD
jgi:hypothetical protein